MRVLKTDVAWVGAGYSFGLNGVADVGHIMPYYGNDARPFIISLDGWAGTQRYAGIWSGDQTGGEWEYIRFHIPTYIGSGLSGQPNICSDMDGIFGGKNAAVNIRDFQWKTFTPMQLNMDGWGANEKYPHALGEPATSINRMYLKLKSELMPYTYSFAREAVDGMPLIRAMFLDYPNEYTYGTATRYQYMYGTDFLVAPVYQNTKADKEGNDIRNGIYLPEGTWIDYNNKQTVYTGEQWTTVEAPLSCIPMFVKQGSIIPTMPVMNYTHEKPVYPLIFEVFPAPKGEEASFTLYEDEGEDLGYQRDEFAKTPVRFRTEEGGYLLSVGAREGKGYAVPAPRNFIFRMYLKTAPKGVTVQGKKVKKVKPERLEENPDDDTESMVWSWDKATGICSLRMPDRGEESRISLRL